ncbi:hypothetical protein Daus18300_000104 [Diaporthe australafricana]|uniref:Uncharacterized protein n=1 Tax=Diaporthe australafricana TaxID=127596 RepID=A0ABR3Y7R0_9PEZI
MSEPSETLMYKPLLRPPPVKRSSQLRKATSSQDLQFSPKSTSSGSRDSERDGRRGSRRTLEYDRRESCDLRHRSSTSAISRTTASSFITSTSGAGTIVGISEDVSANQFVGSGQNGTIQQSLPDQPGRTPLAAISNRASRHVPARNSKVMVRPGQENTTTPAKSQRLDRRASHVYTSPSTPSDKPSEAHNPSPVLPQLRKLQHQIHSLKTENDDLRAVKTTHLAAIDGLRGQLRARDAEHARLVEQLRAEAAALKEEKWALLGHVAELELELQQQQQQQQQVASRDQTMGLTEDLLCAGSVRSVAPASCRNSEAGRRSATGYDTPGSLYSVGVEGDEEGARSLRHTASCSSVATACASSFVRRRRRASVAASDVTAASLAEEELDILSVELAAHDERHGRERRAMAAQLAEVEGDLAAARRQRDRAERRGRELEARLAAQVALVRHHHAPIPDLPVLTYARVGSVWFDTVVSAFKYWGLFEFISTPDESLFAGTDPDHEGRRLRAVVLLKRAMDDDILDDIMYLQNQKCILAPPAAGSLVPQSIPPEIESPYFLFHTAAILKRTVPSSLTDFGWLDWISDADFEGIEGFASLVNILNRRHSQLYGTSAHHYDALVPKIQESMSRRFPDIDRSLMDPGSAPKKWWHLALWMSRMVKKRQGRIAGLDEL